MRLFLLENFVDHEFDITDKQEKEELIEFAKKNCSKALNEFYKPNKYLFRGMTGIDDDSAYIIPTKQKRVPFGSSTKGKTGQSFNEWLAKNGHVRRDKNVAFTTSSMPEDYKGIKNDEWFFFLPIGDYHYSYINTIQGGDFNLHSWVQKSLGTFYYFEDMIDDLESSVNYTFNIIKKIKRDNPHMDFENFPNFKRMEEKLNRMNSYVQQYIMDVAMIYQKGIFSDNNLETLRGYMEKVSDIRNQYDKLNYEMDQAASRADSDENEDEYWVLNTSAFSDAIDEYPLEMLRMMDRNINVDETFKLIDALMQSMVTDKITQYFPDNEIVVECELYLVIPYKMGFEFMDKLVY